MRSNSAMESILSAPSIPPQVLVPTTAAIINLLHRNSDSPTKENMARLLSNIHQRHPEQFQAAATVCTSAARDTVEREAFDRIIISIVVCIGFL